jgi:hypothetical protein
VEAISKEEKAKALRVAEQNEKMQHIANAGGNMDVDRSHLAMEIGSSFVKKEVVAPWARAKLAVKKSHSLW